MFVDKIDLGDFELNISNFEKKDEVIVEIEENEKYASILERLKYNIQPMCLNRTLFPYDKNHADGYLDAALKAIAIDSITSGKGFEYLKKVLYFNDDGKVFLVFNARLYQIDQFEMKQEDDTFYIKSSAEAHMVVLNGLQLNKVYLFVDLSAFNPTIPVYAKPPKNEFFFGYQIMAFNKVVYGLQKEVKKNPDLIEVKPCSELNSQFMKKFEYCVNYLNNMINRKAQEEDDNYLGQVYRAEYQLDKAMDEVQAKRLIKRIEGEKEEFQKFIQNFCVSPNYLTTLCLSFRSAPEKTLESVWSTFRSVYNYEHMIKAQRCKDVFGDQIDTAMREFIFGAWSEEFAEDAFLFADSKWLYLIDTHSRIPF